MGEPEIGILVMAKDENGEEDSLTLKYDSLQRAMYTLNLLATETPTNITLLDLVVDFYPDKQQTA